MKKLMIALAVLAMAFTSQAVVTKWTVLNIKLPTVPDLTQPWSGHSAATDPATSMTVQMLFAGEVVAEKTASGMFQSQEAFSQAKTIEITTAAETVSPTFDIIATVVTGDGTYSYAGTASGNLNNVVTGAKDATITANMTAGTWTFTPKAGPVPPPVPEPTSGLLLLLGVAGLALRRRRA